PIINVSPTRRVKINMSFCSFEYFVILVFLTNGRPVAVATMPPAKPALEGERREAALASP
ncbi:MAG TPA: hypothetical protein VFI49_12925, partial [Rudaea sp.]|nr:hypothetical protein [Rudaea sp.]